MSKQSVPLIRRCSVSGCIRKIGLAWLFAVVMEQALLPQALRDLEKLEGLARMSLLRVAAITCVVSLLLFGISRLADTARAERWGMAGLFGILAIVCLRSSFTWAFFAVCVLILAALLVFGNYGWDSRPEPVFQRQKARGVAFWMTVGLSGAFFLLVSSWTVGRVFAFCSPTYDFGIFSQMFYQMKESGLPMTTLERDGLLSHFAVHVSPIYYLLLPFYCLIPTPATLQVLQAAVVTSAVIPLWKIGTHYGLTGTQRMLICAVLLLYPAYAGGTGYDIHENCFLTPLLLWLFYGIDRRNIALTAAAAMLTLTVKEDAAVYVAVIGLWLIVRSVLRYRTSDRGMCITGAVLLAASLAWFFLVTRYLAEHGDGVMTYRYQNLIFDGSSSLLTVIRSVVLSPMKAIYECVDREKLQFIALTLLPLLGLPLLTRRYERYLLLIPYVLVNLMSDYPYQHDLFFQYTFGSTAFLLYLTVVNLSDWKPDWRRSLAMAMTAASCAVCFGAVVAPRAIWYPVQAIRRFGHYQSIRDVLSRVPEDASVTATTWYTTALSQRETLYDVRYSSRAHMLETQYVVLDVAADSDYQKYATKGKRDGLKNLVRLLEENGYERWDEKENVLVIYRKG